MVAAHKLFHAHATQQNALHAHEKIAPWSLTLKVQLLQSSNKRDSNLTINNEPTFVQGKSVKFHYTDEDYNKIIRACIDAVTSNFTSSLGIKHLSNVKKILHELFFSYESY